MIILFWSLIIFFSALCVHFLMWKICLPRTNHTKVLLAIFFGVLVLGLWILKAHPAFCLMGILPPQALADYAALILLYVSLVLAYITSYSAVEVDSPSLMMIYDIAQAGPKGLKKEEFFARFSDDLLVIPRLDDLVRDGMVVLRQDKYYLTPRGIFWADIFIGFRRLLKAPKGG